MAPPEAQTRRSTCARSSLQITNPSLHTRQAGPIRHNSSPPRSQQPLGNHRLVSQAGPAQTALCSEWPISRLLRRSSQGWRPWPGLAAQQESVAQPWGRRQAWQAGPAYPREGQGPPRRRLGRKGPPAGAARGPAATRRAWAVLGDINGEYRHVEQQGVICISLFLLALSLSLSSTFYLFLSLVVKRRGVNRSGADAAGVCSA